MQLPINFSRIKIRDCNENDYNFIHDLSKENMENYVIKLWGGWDKEKFISKIKKENIKIIEYNNELIGFSDYEIRGNTAYIHNLQIKSNFQGKGIGHYILTIVEQNIKERGIKKISLKVFEDNPAKAFYEKHGYIALGSSDASFIMEKNFG